MSTEVVGVLSVYARAKDAFDDHVVRERERFAVPAAVAVHNAQVLGRQKSLVVQLQAALAMRPGIDQAIGRATSPRDRPGIPVRDVGAGRVGEMNPAFAWTAVLPMEGVSFFGVTLVGVSATIGVKVLLTVALVLVLRVVRWAVAALAQRVLGGDVADSRRFWARQGLQVVTTVVLVLGLVSIWVTPETDVTTGVGLISAGLAFALQQVIISLAGYFVILRGDTFTVGDRITLGGVRGDVVRLGFLKTTIMEMGQPPSVADTDPAVWVNSRQYTGRLATVTNGVIFSEPVYNYTRDFPYLWEEITLPISFTADRAVAESVLLEAAVAHAVVDDPKAEQALRWMQAHYALSDASLAPAVYWRITDNWLELSLRFLVEHRGVRAVKDAMTRDILTGLDQAGIGIASATYEVVGLPEFRIARD